MFSVMTSIMELMTDIPACGLKTSLQSFISFLCLPPYSSFAHRLLLDDGWVGGMEKHQIVDWPMVGRRWAVEV